jgi:phage FluMu protein Com
MTLLKKEVPTNTRASSRGNTRGASVIQNNWA